MKNIVSEFILGCDVELIRNKVILAPCWSPLSVGLDGCKLVVDGSCQIWDCNYNGCFFTYIVAGVGAGLCADIVMSLGATMCNSLLFIGSAGALVDSLNIGDFVVPDAVICAEGASRFHQEDFDNDMFGKRILADDNLGKKIYVSCSDASRDAGVSCERGLGISVESLYSEHRYIPVMQQMGCTFVDMEASAVLFSAQKSKIQCCACMCISDNTVKGEDLMTLAVEKTAFRKAIRQIVMPRVISAFLE